jgi:hypothetical protein
MTRQDGSLLLAEVGLVIVLILVTAVSVLCLSDCVFVQLSGYDIHLWNGYSYCISRTSSL